MIKKIGFIPKNILPLIMEIYQINNKEKLFIYIINIIYKIVFFKNKLFYKKIIFYLFDIFVGFGFKLQLKSV